MRDLNPYDTGERLEPVPYVSTFDAANSINVDPDRYGKLDLDDNEGATMATLWTERNGYGGHDLHVELWDSHMQVHVHK